MTETSSDELARLRLSIPLQPALQKTFRLPLQNLIRMPHLPNAIRRIKNQRTVIQREMLLLADVVHLDGIAGLPAEDTKPDGIGPRIGGHPRTSRGVSKIAVSAKVLIFRLRACETRS